MKPVLIKILLLVFFSLNLTACGTIVSLSSGDYAVYGGVTKDLAMLQEGTILAIFIIIDLPLSFILDTLILPVTLSH